MPTPDRDAELVRHILRYCRQIDAAHADFDRSQARFAQSTTYQNAISMCILQIGELANHLGQDFRTSHPGMPWNEIRGMRNVMAHAYGSISVQATWETIQQDIPALKAFCLEILSGK